MASARVEIVQPEPPPRKVILELTEEEATDLMNATRRGGTAPLSSIFRALADLFIFDEDAYKLNP